MRAINLTIKKEIANNVIVAKGILERMKGLIGHSAIKSGDALLIKPCKGIHTFGMKFPIDVIFLDKGNNVIAVKKYLPPNRITPIYLRAKYVLELPEGTVEETSTSIDDTIEII